MSLTDSDNLPAIPNLELPQSVFILQSENLSHLHEEAHKTLLAGIQNDEMAPFAATLPTSILPERDALVTQFSKANDAVLKEIEQSIAQATENEGESEISEGIRKRAMYYARIGDKSMSIDSITTAIEKTAGIGSKIDLTLTLIRLGMFFSDFNLVVQNIATAKTLVEQGGDWDRRNRLKVYIGLHAASIRDFKLASTQFLSTLSTFTSTELINYDQFVIYTVIVSVFALDRVDLKTKVINAPEVVALMHTKPLIRNFANSLYDCDYALLFKSLAEIEETYLKPSVYLHQHSRYYTREIRIRAYAQLLESYKSLNISSLAKAFGVSEEFIDKEFSKLIPAGRLHCVLDKVTNVVESNRPDSRNKQYQQVVQNGDVLLNSIQKLARVLN
ncbi:PCI-domain-containing protein [Wallemia mellicola]|uniref:PCI-domain-containing protein n=1 Tax=Wallemia mellicola TaxID=1708541 RepID=A0AB38N2X8_9BASI|nr:PCI-domain-containing protein [Wallemia mellicola]TIC45989.1 PCI-domain-containing protein [Wallemia mellicola]TIC57119.1 PCI-domain-containing protein [Wallemia mellicola]TIC70957.1 PCI-domain-containing protein [Wallemia mellicola]